MLPIEARPPICLIHPPGWVSVNPTVQSMVAFLNDRGHLVHLLTLDSVGSEGGTVVNDALSADWPLFKNSVLRRIRFLVMPIYVWLKVRRLRPGAIFAVDLPGATAALVTLFLTQVQCIYISLHMSSFLDLWRRGSYVAALRTLVARIALNRMTGFITQDRYRQKAFVDANRLPTRSKVFFIVPNSHRGRAERMESSYYHDKFRIPPERALVLIAGMVQAAWSHTEFLVDCAKAQGDSPHYTLIVQSREKLSNAVVRNFADFKHENVILSLEPIPFSELRDAFASATVGAAIYSGDSSWNQSLVGGASGKMMSYLHAGTPVIMSDGAGVTDVIESFGCGEVLKGLRCTEFNALVRRIVQNRDTYSANAVRCYNQVYEFDQAFLEVYEFLFGRIAASGEV